MSRFHSEPDRPANILSPVTATRETAVAACGVH